MFELRLALRYLVPRKKSLSTALISLVSVGVISVVVWLVLVFLSVTAGIERNWLSKLTSLYAPLRIAPTDEYYRSYFFQVDSLSAASRYTPKTIGEKWAAPRSDPHAKESDMEIPLHWPAPDLDAKGELKDPVKRAVEALHDVRAEIPFQFQDFEIGGALLKLQLERPGRTSQLSQMSYLLSLADQNPRLPELLLPFTPDDLEHAGAFPLAEVQGGQIVLPEVLGFQPILLPKSYRDNGVFAGDTGALLYSALGSASSQQQRIAVRVAGFYDPGLMSMGSRCLLAPTAVTRTIYATLQTSFPDGTPTNGFFVWPSKLEDASLLKERLVARFETAGLSPYWKISTFEEYEFAKDLLHQFRSDKLLFTLIAGIILLVACCNIISLLILLVNDKKREIAILQAMGATSWSIGSLFALCGVAMGLLSCCCGVLLALLTLHHLDWIVSALSALQGHAAFNPLFFGQHLPNQLSHDALWFVLIVTPLLSLLAGLIPALKAARVQPSPRAEGRMILTASHLHKSFRSPEPVSVLSGVSLQVKEGESIAITGRSGEGKTTLLHILGSLEPFDSGELLFEGKPLLAVDAASLRNRSFGFVFQSFNLLDNETVLDNVLMPARIGRRVIDRNHGRALLQLVGMEHRALFAARLLSGGERQRVAIARALCNNPAILFADEPSGNLDRANANEVRQLLFELVRSQRKTLLLATHDEELAALCDQRFVLSQGVLKRDT